MCHEYSFIRTAKTEGKSVTGTAGRDDGDGRNGETDTPESSSPSSQPSRSGNHVIKNKHPILIFNQARLKYVKLIVELWYLSTE